MNKSNRSLSSFGCLSLNAIAAAGGVVLLVVAFSLAQGGALFSPGALSAQAGAPALGGVASHAEITRCQQCHPPPFSGGSMAGACLTCHTDLSQDPKNFHTLMVAQGQLAGCHTCHTEHRGAAAALTKDNIGNFPHNQLGFALLAHQKMADGSPFRCSGCHPTTYVRFDPDVCASCHKQIQPQFMNSHTAAFGPDCRACHDGLDSYGQAFDHQRAAFPLAGKHAALTCEKCHAPVGASATLTLADLKGAPQTCAACHAKDDAHKGQYGQECGACHTPADWKPATFDHAKSAFPLVGKHQTVPCQGCHANSVFKGTPQTCAGCHADPVFHRGLFGAACANCHTTTAWTPAKFNLAHTFPIQHERGGNTCRTCHPASLSQYTCNQCHSPASLVKEHRNRGDISNCIRCHADGKGGD